MTLSRRVYSRAVSRARAMARLGYGPAAVWRSPWGVYTVGYMSFPHIGLGEPVYVAE